MKKAVFTLLRYIKNIVYDDDDDGGRKLNYIKS